MLQLSSKDGPRPMCCSRTIANLPFKLPELAADRRERRRLNSIAQQAFQLFDPAPRLCPHPNHQVPLVQFLSDVAAGYKQQAGRL